jgi:hypothetical protein
LNYSLTILTKSYLVCANASRHVVFVILRSESGEGDRVLDVDGVMLGARNERSVRISERKLVDLDWTPGHDLAHEDVVLTVAGHAVPRQGSVAFALARNVAADTDALRDVDEAGRLLSSANNF